MSRTTHPLSEGSVIRASGFVVLLAVLAVLGCAVVWHAAQLDAQLVALARLVR